MFEKIVKILNLGDLIKEPSRIHGGYSHRMFSVETDKGHYAIKILNSNVMKRETALPNFERADSLEKQLEENNIPCIYSKEINGKKLQMIDGEYFYVYDYYPGKMLEQKNINKKHVYLIGKEMANIHNIDIKEYMNTIPEKNINFKHYIELAKEQNSVIYDYIYDKLDILNESMIKGNEAIKKAPAISTICHNDLDRKNVLWNGEDYKIIDLECLCYSNPYLDLLESALCWAGYEKGDLDLDLFKTFMKSYKDNAKIDMNINWEDIYYLNNGRLEWLHYSIRRALLIECTSKEEQEMGIEQVKETIKDVIYYNDIKDKILEAIGKILEGK